MKKKLLQKECARNYLKWRVLDQKIFQKTLCPPPPPQTPTLTFLAGVDGEQSRGASLKKHGSEDPHQRQ